MFNTDIEKQVKLVNRRLNQIASKGIRLAAAETLNTMAFQSRVEAIKIFEKDRIIRNKWNEKGMRFETTKKNIPIMQMETRSGSIRDYGDEQESGGTVKPNSKYIPVPTKASRTGGKKVKRIAGKYNINNLKVNRLPKFPGSRKRRFAAMLNIARKKKQYDQFVIPIKTAGLPSGIFELKGHGRGKPGGGKIKILRHLTKTAKIKANPYVRPAGEKIGKKMDKIYIRRANIALKRFGRDIK